MLIIYRVVRRSRGTTTEMSKHHDMAKPKLGLQINTATPFSDTEYKFSAPPTMSTRGIVSPYYPPPYAADPFEDFPIGIVPQSPSANPAHMSSVQKLGIKPSVQVGP